MEASTSSSASESTPIAPAARGGEHLLDLFFRPSTFFASRDSLDTKWLIVAAMWGLGIIPVTYAGAFVGDLLVSDPYAFWFHDAWDGSGTGFEHLPVQSLDGRMSSLWIERSGWTRIEK